MKIVQQSASLTRKKKRQNTHRMRVVNNGEAATYTGQLSRVKRQYMLIYGNTFETVR